MIVEYRTARGVTKVDVFNARIIPVAGEAILLLQHDEPGEHITWVPLRNIQTAIDVTEVHGKEAGQ